LQPESQPGVGGALSASVSDDGTFAIRGIPEGSARLLATLNSESYYLKAIRLDGNDVADQAIPIAAGATVSGIEVVVGLDAAELRGSVYSDDSAATADAASVVLFPSDRKLWQSSPRLIKVATTTVRGPYLIRGIMPGDYRVAAVGKALDSVDPTVLAALASSADNVTIAAGTVEKHVLRAKSGPSQGK